MINTSRMVGGALGLAVLATLASSRSKSDLRHPTASVHTAGQALVSGFHVAFLVAAGMVLVGTLVAAIGMPSLKARSAEVPQSQRSP